MVRRCGLGAGAAVLSIAAAALSAGCGAGHHPQHHPQRTQQSAAKPTYAQLVAKNYKVLTPKQTRRLLRYAEGVHACLAKWFRVGEPVTQPTRIVMRLPVDVAPSAVLQRGLECEPKIGKPPPGASLQVRGHVVLVYLPKYCILDRKVARQH
jgi:hypothetical protein